MVALSRIHGVLEELDTRAEKARRYLPWCRHLANHARTVGKILSNSSVVVVGEDDAASRRNALCRLMAALDDALDLVNSCGRHSRCFSSWVTCRGRTAARFLDIDMRIAACVQDLSLGKQLQVSAGVNGHDRPRRGCAKATRTGSSPSLMLEPSGSARMMHGELEQQGEKDVEAAAQVCRQICKDPSRWSHPPPGFCYSSKAEAEAMRQIPPLMMDPSRWSHPPPGSAEAEARRQISPSEDPSRWSHAGAGCCCSSKPDQAQVRRQISPSQDPDRWSQVPEAEGCCCPSKPAAAAASVPPQPQPGFTYALAQLSWRLELSRRLAQQKRLNATPARRDVYLVPRQNRGTVAPPQITRGAIPMAHLHRDHIGSRPVPRRPPATSVPASSSAGASSSRSSGTDSTMSATSRSGITGTSSVVTSKSYPSIGTASAASCSGSMFLGSRPR